MFQRHLSGSRTRSGRGLLVLVVVLCLTCTLVPGTAGGFVAGSWTHKPLSSHKIFGNAKAIGNTLMLPGPAGTEIRSILLANSSATLSGLPADAVVEKAYLFWSGSLAQTGVTGPKTADTNVSFAVANGTQFSVGGTCTTVTHPTQGTNFPSFFYCRGDVTSQVKNNKLAGSYNGVYIVGNMSADPGHINQFTGNCTETPYPRCQAKYGAWSIVVIYSSASETLLRDIHLYDGFQIIDHEDGPSGSLGVTSFTIGNFLADTTPQGTLTYFAVETDSQLGVPPQNLSPPPLTCATCQDYVRFNGTTLTDSLGWPGNMFNESLGNGYGVDIDTIEIGNLISPGATQATIEIGSGTSPVITPQPSHGGGELFGFGWTLLAMRRPAPNFKTPATNKSVNPIQAGQGETLAYTVNIVNAGSLAASNTQVTDILPAGVNLKPNSIQVGGVPCTDAADSDPCTVSGKTMTFGLGTVSHVSPSNSRQITFLATVAASATNGQVVCNAAQVTSVQTPSPHSTNNACFTVKAPELNTPTKVDLDLNGGVFQPDDIIQFTVNIGKKSGQVSGLTFDDDIPANMQLLSALGPAGSSITTTTTGGKFGRGAIKVTNITIPAAVGSVNVVFTTQVDSVTEFVAGGVPVSAIDGRQLCNQGSVSALFLPAAVLTDDPAAAGTSNATCFNLTFSPNMSASNKTAVDVNGGKLEPGDTLRYTVNFTNTGNQEATLSVMDDMPSHVSGFTWVTTLTGAVFTPGAGINSTGQITVTNLKVPPGATRSMVFEVTVLATVPNNVGIQNCAAFTVAEKASEGRTICSPTLTTFATPALNTSTKTVTDLNGGQVQPGDALRYSVTVTNTGNKTASGVVVTDPVSSNLTSVVALDGGTYSSSAGTVTWNVGTLSPGASVTVRFQASVVTPLANNTLLCNQGSINSAQLAPVSTDDPTTAQVDDATCVTVVSAPDLGGLIKTVVDLNGAPTRPGDTLRYTIAVTNSGNETATGVTVKDIVPTQLTAVTPLDGGTFVSPTITWNVGTLDPGQTKTVRFQAKVLTPLPNGTKIGNQASVTAAQVPVPQLSDDPSTAALDDPTVVTVTSAADLSAASKTVVDVNGGLPQPGDQLLYTITISNAGDATARNTVITDQVSTNLTGVTPLDGGAYNAVTRTITWPAADVVPGVDRIVRFSAGLVFPMAGGTKVCNQALISSLDVAGTVKSDDPATGAVDDPTCVTVQSQPDLSQTTKSVQDLNGGQVVPGDTLRYAITVSNVGTQNAVGVSITDVVSTSLTSVTPQDGGVYNSSTRTITWSPGQVTAKGQVTVHFLAQVVLPLDDGTKINNQALVKATGLASVLTDDPATPATDDPTVVTVSAAPSFVTSTKQVTDANGGKVEPGDSLTYTLKVVNSGTSAADLVQVTDILSQHLEFVSVGQGGSYNSATRTITWSAAGTAALNKLGVGAAAGVTLTFAATVKNPLLNGTQICNQGRVTSAEVTAFQLTDNPATPAAGDATCVTASSAPDLAGAAKIFSDANGSPVRPGDTLTWTITVPNTGNSTASNVVVTDQIDQNLTAVVPGQGGVYNALTRTITWSASTTPGLAALAAKTSVTLTFTAQVAKPLDNGTSIENQAIVSSPDLSLPVKTDDPATAAIDDPTALVVVAAPALDTTEKTVVDTNGGDVEPGDALTWTLTLKNTGDAVAKSVVVTDLVDPSLTAVTPLDGGVYDSVTRTITWNIPQVDLSPGGDVTVRFSSTVVSPLKNNTLIKNQGKVAVSPGVTVLTDDPATAIADDPTQVTVISKPDLTGMKKAVAGGQPNKKVAPGTTLTFTIEVPNTGSEDATNLLVTDVVDTDLEAVVPLDGGSYDSATRTISWTRATLTAGDTAVFRFTAKVKADSKNGDTIENQAFAQAVQVTTLVPSDDPSTPQQDDPTVLTIEAIPDLEQFTKAVKDVNGGDAEPGDTLQYTLVIKNTGTAYAFNVKISDPIQISDLEGLSIGQGGQLNSATGTITWDGNTTPALAKMAPGDQVTLTFSVKIKVPTANGKIITNQAVASADGAITEPSDDPATPQVDDSTDVKVVSVPRLGESTKTAADLNGGQLKPGDVVEYVIKVVNNGTAAATNTKLIDTIPPYTKYIVNSTRLNGSPVPDVGGLGPAATGMLINSPGMSTGQVTVGASNAAEIRFRVRVSIETQHGTIISNQGLITSTETGVEPTDDPGTAAKDDPTQLVVGKGPNLSAATKLFNPVPVGDNGNNKFDVGEVIAYTVTIPNTGTSAATGVIFTDPLDPNKRATFVTGSLGLNGGPLTDAADGDAGTAVSNSLRVVVGTIAPGKSAVITYQVRIASGPQVSNQGTIRSTQLQPEFTDADGNDANGDTATVVPINGPASRKLRGTKTALDVNGEKVAGGDEILYTITVFNDGNTDENMDITDHIPLNTRFITGSVILPPGATRTFTPPPGGQFTQGRLNIAKIQLKAGSSATVLFRVQLGSNLKTGTAVCNTARLGSGGGLDIQTPLDQACVLLGSPAGTGGLTGRVFRDLGQDNRTVDPDDQLMAGFQVQAFAFGNPNAAPLATAVSDAQGSYSLAGLAPGVYTVRTLTSKGVQMAAAATVTVNGGQANKKDLPVDPSGVAYDSVTGKAMASVQAFLRYDKTDPSAPGALVPSALLGLGQQGQITDSSGFYRFDVQRGRKYALEVKPLSSSLQFPSSLIPTTPGFAKVGPDNEVVTADTPNPKQEGAILTYYLRFDIDDKIDGVFNNHIPLDPLTSLIRLQKRTDRSRASMGDIITYTITVQNRSTRDFTAPGSRVAVEDILPRGLRFLRNTSRLIRRVKAAVGCLTGERRTRDLDGATACVRRLEPQTRTGRVLRYTPIVMGAGESFRLVYQMAVGLDTRQGSYVNRAVLRDEGFASTLSNRGEATVLVEPDPDLDQGLLIGKVFCDRDKDGRQGKGEYGLAGARIYLDNGTYSVTDRAGKYHLRDIDPGLHLVKIDVNTLPVSSRMTTDESRVVQFSRGLPAKINFGVSCKQRWVAVQRVKLKPKKKKKKPKKKKSKLAVPGLSLAGDAAALRLSVDGQVVPTLDVDLALTHKAHSSGLVADWSTQPRLNLRRGTRGGLANPMVFHLRARNRTVRGWRMTVWQIEGGGRRMVKRFSGQGQPPAQLVWDGSAGGKGVMKRGAVYEARVEVVAFEGAGATSPRRRFAVQRRAAPPAVQAKRGAAYLDGTALVLDGKGRFARVVGRPERTAVLIELRRGDGKTTWLTVGAAAQETEDGPMDRIHVKGNLRTLKLSVDSKVIDTSLLGLTLSARLTGDSLPPLARDGRLKQPVEIVPAAASALIRKWTLRISDVRGKEIRTFSGHGPAPAAQKWDGLDAAGAPVIQPGETYLARFSVEDARGNLGRSPLLELRAPAAIGFSPLKLKARQLFNLKSGKLVGRQRVQMIRALRRLRRRPAGERYRMNVRLAPPVTWESGKWAGYIKSVERALVSLMAGQGLPRARYELSVGALPLPSAPVVPKRKRGRGRGPGRKLVRLETIHLDAIPPTPAVAASSAELVAVDGEMINVGEDGAFSTWAKIKLGSAMILDIRTGAGNRALLIIPTEPSAPIPTSRLRTMPRRLVAAAVSTSQIARAPLSLRMRRGGSLELRLAQGPGSQPAASQPAASQPAAATSQPASSPSAAGARVPASRPAAANAARPTRSAGTGAAFGAEVLRKAFGQPGKPTAPPRPKHKVPAAKLRVDLPPRGVALKSNHLALRGETHPKNKVTINGGKVLVAPDGTFNHVTKLPDGKSVLVIIATDTAGNQGIIRWPVEVSDRALFIMAMAEGAIGQLGAELDGDTDHSRLEAGPVMLHGRAVLYLKGRIKGKYLFKKYFFTAHVDTAKQREFGEFFDQVVDPNRYYPVYGDSSRHVTDVNARDKYYLMVKADRSTLQVGNFYAGIKGIDLLRYDRVLYGAKLDFDKKLFKNRLRQQVKAFVSYDDSRLTRDHNVLRATGGSIYYLRHGQVLEGSERVRLIVRERTTGIELSSVIKSRDLDYVIDYPGGRILFKSPVSSVSDTSFGINNPSFSLSTLAGQPVYVEVDYEYQSDGEQGQGSWGVQVKDTLFDVLTLGGSYVSESRNDQVGGDYRLYGGELTLRHGQATQLTFEVARSESYNMQNYISEDGGITYLSLNHVQQLSADARANDSNAYKVGGRLDFSDFFKKVKPATLTMNGYFSMLERGFYSGGNILDQGRTKYGGRVDWAVTDQDKITLRHDGAVALLPQMPITGGTSLDPLAMREIQTELSRIQYATRRGRLRLQAEFAHNYLRDPLSDGLDSNRGTVGVMASYRIWKRLRLLVGQDAILFATGNDPQLGTPLTGLSPVSNGDWRGHLLTTVGVAWGVTRNLEIQLAEAVRWNGDNATILGLKASVSKTASMYVRQQVGTSFDRLSTTTVVGAEDRFGPTGGGKTYGEYQLQSGVLGTRNRAILGLSHKWTPLRGISFTGGYEHQQVFGGHLPDGTPTGDSQRDVLHIGVEYIRPRTLKLSSRFELRYDNGSGIAGLGAGTAGQVTSSNVDARAGLGKGYYADRLVNPGTQLQLAAGERWQFVTRNAISWLATEDITMMGRANYYRTQNTTTGRLEAQALELGVGAALRPVEWDWLNVLIKYTHLLEMRPISLIDDLARWRTYDVVSVMPILDLPFRFQLVEKFAYKRVLEQQDLLEGEILDTTVHTLLWINRLNFHITGRLDAGVEYRFMKMMFDDQGSQLKHGALIELGYWLYKYVRLGVGYNFSSFSDDEFTDQDRDAKGFFFRVVGRY